MSRALGPLPALTLTGERTVPGIAAENYWFRRHEAAYRHVAGLLATGAPHRVLLEVGAGEGYGTALLSERAGLTCALDYDRCAISHLGARYRRLNPVQANLATLPVRSGAVDVLVSLQVIEHVWDHRQFLGECARVLRRGGLLVLSTPNRLTFSPGAAADQRPRNPFHTHEFTAAELRALVRSAGFARLRSSGLHAGTALAALDAGYRQLGGFVEAQLEREAADWPEPLRAEVASITAADFTVRSGDLDASLDLILVATAA